MKTALFVLAIQASAPQGPRPGLADQVSGTIALLQAVSVVNDRVVWVSGHKATFVRTVDGGMTWKAGVVPGDTTLQFRDVYAIDENSAYLMSSGTGKASRIYFTKDGGNNWTLQYTNPDSAGFYDCMAFWDRDHGLVTGDEVGGLAVVLTTSDGGAHWMRIPPASLPTPHPHEGSFAASGLCLITMGDRHAWISTGAGMIARVFHTADRGRIWSAAETPVTHANATSGLTSVAFRDTLNGIVVGGDVGKADIFTDNVAVTHDGGRSWTLSGKPAISGGLFGVVYVPRGRTVVAVGPKGATWSDDEGATWKDLDTRAYWSIGFAPNGTGWMVGPGGRITKVSFPR